MRRFVRLLFVVVLPALLFAQDFWVDLERLKDEISERGKQMEYVYGLTDDIGHRLTGSPGAEKAENAVVDWLKALGLENVRKEPFRMEARWSRGTASAQIMSPVSRALTVASYTWTPSTPGTGVQGHLVDGGTGKPEDIAAVKSRMRGAIVLVAPAGVTLDEVIGNFYRTPLYVEECAKAGALAVLIASDKERTLLYTAPVSFNAKISPVAALAIAREDVELLRRLLNRPAKPGSTSDVRIRVAVKNTVDSPFLANNVFGEIQGSEKSEEVILLGAHLDSNDLGPGALDNAAGCAALLETARAIKALGLQPKRTIRFVFFMGEEEGMIGSTEYVKRHLAEMDNFVTNITMDIGAGRPLGWFSMGRTDLDPEIRAFMESQLYHPDSVMIVNAAFAATDNAAFMAAGVPNLVLLQDDASYFPVHHTAADTPDKIVLEDFTACVTTVAMTAYLIASQEERFGRRLTQSEIEDMMNASKIEYQWRAANIWPLQ
ncbi:MAG: M20/M25/M40 family metallo-hydrolase [Ignavibacteriae bacterium]|nr:M20/M25/M40 family metallo-hydrolase [Ignavibacteriota bacterium]